VTVDGAWEGLKHTLNGVVFKPGEKLSLQLTFDKGTTNANVRLYLQELDSNGAHLSWNVLNGNLSTGTFKYSYTIKAGTKILLRIDKNDTYLNETTYFYVDEVKLSKGELTIVQEKNYYPFGLQHNGYNATVNGRNHEYGYNGIELTENLGLNLYEMDFRKYDPAIARFNGIDPITHYSMGTSVAFDNNPIYWADPSGADATNLINDAINAAGNGNATFTNNNDGTFSGSNGTTINSDSGGDPPNKFKQYFDAKAQQVDQVVANMENTTNTPLGSKDMEGLNAFANHKSEIGGIGKLAGFAAMGLSHSHNVWAAKNTLTVFSPITQISNNQFVWNAIGRWSPSSFQSGGIPWLRNFSATGFRTLGRTAGFIGITGSLLQYRSGQIDSFTFGSDSFWTGVGMYGGPVGWIQSGLYYLFNVSGAKAGAERRALQIHKDVHNGISPREAVRKYSCFVKGTKVLMADLTEKNIEDIILGDKIMSVNMHTMQLEKDLVIEIPNTMKKYRRIEMKLKNGMVNKFSPAHPFWIKNKGWAVYDTVEAKSELTFSVKQLKEGDIVLYYDAGVLKETVIETLQDTKEYIEMFNVEYVKKNNTFFANGILVHNKRLN